MNRIKEARKAAGLSQKYVALTLGVAGPSVSNWESGKTKPTPENYVALSQLFSVSVDYLMGVDDSTTETVIQNQLPVSAPDLFPEFQELAAQLTEEQRERAAEYMRFLITQRK